MTRFGYASGRANIGQTIDKVNGPATTEELARASLDRGAMDVIAEVVERGMHPSAPRQDITRVALPDGSDIVRRTADAPKDPRTPEQIAADEWIIANGPCDPMPCPSRRRR